MPTPTYTLITSTTLTATSTTVTFSSIPSTYTDLVVRVSARLSVGSNYFQIQFNGDTSTIYSQTRLGGTGSAAQSSRDSGVGNTEANAVSSTYTASTFSNVDIYIPNYNSTSNKPYGVFGTNENNATASQIDSFAQLYRNTSALTSITLTGSNFVSDSSFFLYGIKNS